MKPILYLIPAFDAASGTTIKFSWLGNIPMSNTLRIKNNDTREIVYEVTQETMKLEHTISPNNNIKNGTLYNASIRVTDRNNSVSEWSDVLLFYCFTMPTFEINIAPGQIIQAQTYGVEITYEQSEGELLQSYRARVYNANNEIIFDSGTRYVLDTIRISNLQDNGDYSIVVNGTTINGMELSTGAVNFSVDFLQSEAYFICELENLYETGGIYIKSNIVSVEGHSDKEVSYINGEIADLTNNVVHFDEDFSIEDNFSLLIKGTNFAANKQILRLRGVNDEVSVYYKYNPHKSQYYFELVTMLSGNVYVITADSPEPSKEISLWVKRINSLYQLEVIT